jgi:hypothetical protein
MSPMLTQAQVSLTNVANKAASPVFALGTGFATVMEYLPGIMGSLASLAAIIWVGIQVYYFIKEKKKQGL